MKSLWIMCAICVISTTYLCAFYEEPQNKNKPPLIDDCGCSEPVNIEEKCATGCAAIPDTKFSKENFLQTIRTYAKDPLTKQSAALETLLFYGKETQKWLAETSFLDKEHMDILQRELQKKHVAISLRIVDENNDLRLELEPTIVKVGEKYHQHIHKTKDMQEVEISGTIKRVGVDHLWSRF